MVEIILGFIGSIVAGFKLYYVDTKYPFIWLITVLVIFFISSFITGMLFIGFGEIIFLLQKNLNINIISAKNLSKKNTNSIELSEK